MTSVDESASARASARAARCMWISPCGCARILAGSRNNLPELEQPDGGRTKKAPPGAGPYLHERRRRSVEVDVRRLDDLRVARDLAAEVRPQVLGAARHRV